MSYINSVTITGFVGRTKALPETSSVAKETPPLSRGRSILRYL